MKELEKAYCRVKKDEKEEQDVLDQHEDVELTAGLLRKQFNNENHILLY